VQRDAEVLAGGLPVAERARQVAGMLMPERAAGSVVRVLRGGGRVRPIVTWIVRIGERTVRVVRVTVRDAVQIPDVDAGGRSLHRPASRRLRGMLGGMEGRQRDLRPDRRHQADDRSGADAPA
jgi:hypothetical protein